MRHNALVTLVVATMCLLSGLSSSLRASDQQVVKAEWTVIVYMNAKNDLECFALHNFEQMAAVGSSQRVNVLVELGRLKQHQPGCDDKELKWSGILRYKITKGMAPTRQNALHTSVPRTINDMGSKATLAEFISWSMKKYPAEHYMVIIWNHGQGWRLQQRAGLSNTSALDTTNASLQKIYGGVRSVSYDSETHHRLFNADISGAIRDSTGNNAVDVIGFDACLMSMVETAYQMKDIAHYMLGSEELEPGAGWNYEALLNGLGDSRKGLVESVEMVRAAYAQDYSDTHATLDFVDLSQVQQLAKAVSSWARAMENNLSVEAPVLKRARAECTPYGRWYRKSDPSLQTSVDLHRLASLDAKYTTDSSVQSAASKVAALIESPLLIKSKYASQYSDDHFAYGSWGLAIYFPESKQAFEADAENSSGYRVGNTDHPVAFVGEETWAGFLQQYYSSLSDVKAAARGAKR